MTENNKALSIAVISPVRRAGNTVAALMLGYGISMTQSLKVLLTYTGVNPALTRYIGYHEAEDATRTISQVVKLLAAKAMAPTGLSDYCAKLGTNLELFDSATDSITEEERADLLEFVFDRAPHDVMICDVSEGIEDSVSRRILKASDMIVLVTDTDYVSTSIIKEWMQSEYWPKGKPVMLLVNKYNPEMFPLSDFASKAGFKTRDTCKLHYNSFIGKLTNTEDLDSIIHYVLNKDPRVVELNMDLKECVQFITSHMPAAKFKWEG